MNKYAKRFVVGLLFGGAVWLAWTTSFGKGSSSGARGTPRPAPVEVAAATRGPIEWRRTFSGTLEARQRFVLAAHVPGRVRRVLVDLADPVKKGQVVAELDDDESDQGVAQARAAMAVADARAQEANDAATISAREFQRLQSAEAQGLASTAELDVAKSESVRRQSDAVVARAEVKRAAADLRLARIRSNYTKIVAEWAGDDTARVVARRHVAEGDMVRANDPLFTVVALAPLMAVVYVTEKEYRHLKPGQPAVVRTDAHPKRTFAGTVARVAPVFEEDSRQARVEIAVENSDGRLKPGMFARTEIVLQSVPQAHLVPADAVVVRGGKKGVFVVSKHKTSVAWRAVDLGIADGTQVEILGPPLTGHVVTLGHQLIDDKSSIRIVTASVTEARAP